MDDAAEKDKAAKSIVSSAFTCADFLNRMSIKRPFVLCSGKGILDELRGAGVTNYVATVGDDGRAKEDYLQLANAENVDRLMCETGDIDAIVVAWDLQITAVKIAVAATHLKRHHDSDAETSSRSSLMMVMCSSEAHQVLGVTEPDAKCSAPNALFAVGTGAICKCICSAVALQQEAIDVGKHSDILLNTLRRPESEGGYGVDFASTVMIGDTLSLDIAFANRAGMRSLLVFSGATAPSEFNPGNDFSQIPSWCLSSLAEI